MLVYVDKTELGDSTTYNPITRLNTGGVTRKYYTIKSAVDYIASLGDGGGHTLAIRSGVHNGAYDYASIIDADHANLQITCDSETTIYPTTDTYALRTGPNAVDAIISGGTWKTSQTKSAYYSEGGDVSIEDSKFVFLGAQQIYAAVWLEGSGNANLRGITVRGHDTGSTGGIFRLGGSRNANVDMCVFDQADDTQKRAFSSVQNASTGTLNIRHSLLLGCRRFGLYNSTTGITNIDNSIILGGDESSDCVPIYKGSGAVHVKNSMFLGGLLARTNRISNVALDTDENNISTCYDPQLKNAIGGFILPQVDDSNAVRLSYVSALESLLTTYGFTATWFVTAINEWTADDIVDINEMISRGTVEIGCHSYSHSHQAASGTVFTVTKGDETITIDRDNDSITLSGGGIVSGFKSKSLATIKTNLEALGATVTPSAIYGGTGISSNCQGECFAGGVDVNTMDLLIDTTGQTGFYKFEMGESRNFLLDLFGGSVDGQTGGLFECRSFGYPYNSGNADSRLATINLGYSSARYIDTVYNQNNLFGYDLYKIQCLGSWTAYLKGDGSESTIRLNARTLAIAAVYLGLGFSVLSHTTDEFTIEQWGWAFDEWASFDALSIVSQQIMADVLRETMVDDGDGTLSKIWESGPNGRMKNTSPCVDAGAWITGVNDTGEADPWGNYVHRLPNIGADQGAGSPGSVAIVFNMEAS